MKTYIPLFTAFLLLLTTTTSGAQSYLWAKQGKSSNSCSADFITTDNLGNVYITGTASGITLFDDKKITGLVSADSAIFVAKYNASGKIQWVTPISPINTDTTIQIDVANIDNNTPFGIVVNKQQETYVLASLLSLMEIYGFRTESNEVIVGKDTITTGANIDIGLNYIVKFGAAGNVLWAKTVDTSDAASALAIDSKGNLLVAVQGAVLTCDSSGTVLKTTPINALITGFAIDSLDNWYATGTFYDSLSLGSFKFKNTSGYGTAFVAKFNSIGQPLWVKTATSENEVTGNSIIVDNKRNVYVAGKSYDTLHYGNLTLNGPITGYSYIVKFDSSGNGKWIKPCNGENIGKGAYGNFYVTGGGTITNMDTTGTVLWNLKINGVNSIATGPYGMVYAIGDFYGAQSFGATTLISDSSKFNIIDIITDAYITALLDSSAPYKSSAKISGTLFSDLNKNCIKDNNEHGIQGQTIVAEPGPYYAVTDTSGNYTLNVDTGMYTVRQLTAISDSIINLQECPAIAGYYTVAIKEAGKDTAGINFADTTFNCYVLNVSFYDDNNYYGSIDPYSYTTCGDLQYSTATTLSYYNTGNATAYGVKISVNYPSGILLSKASMPYTTVNDSTFYFTIDTLNAGALGTISLTDSVPCTIHALETFTYHASISPLNCLAQDTVYNSSYTQKSVSLQQLSAVVSASFATNISLYPNPTKGNFTLLFKEADSYQITVYNNLGQQVQTANINGAQASLSLDNAAQGIYYVNITSNKGSATKKLIVE